jgi:hypothetical protein
MSQLFKLRRSVGEVRLNNSNGSGGNDEGACPEQQAAVREVRGERLPNGTHIQTKSALPTVGEGRNRDSRRRELVGVSNIKGLGAAPRSNAESEWRLHARAPRIDQRIF